MTINRALSLILLFLSSCAPALNHDTPSETIGPTGAQGSPGLDGSQGDKGKDGLSGINGSTGISGANGANGNTGLIGATGSAGSMGAAGAGCKVEQNILGALITCGDTKAQILHGGRHKK